MPDVLLLGTGAGFTVDGSREPTMLALRGEHSTVLVDCGANAVRQLQQMQVPLASLERLILTHSHPDHTCGFPLLVQMLWLAGRRAPLPVHAPPDTLDLARRLLAQWDTSGWDDLFELQWQPVALEQGAPVAVGADFEIVAAPGIHSVPVIGLRARAIRSGRVVAYSADGEPSPGVRWLAREAGLLVHEAGGAHKGHSTAQAAAELAREAGARQLVLVHLAEPQAHIDAHVTAAREIFGPDVLAGSDLERHTF
jgi:ribonuclease Z